MRPLFMLSFLVDDYLAENDFFGARSVILSSASSKTAFGLAYLLHTLRTPVRVIGLTSAGNAAFVRSLGCYDDVVIYDDVATMSNDAPAAYVDMAGSAELRARLHHRFGDNLTHSARIGPHSAGRRWAPRITVHARMRESSSPEPTNAAMRDSTRPGSSNRFDNG